MSYRFIRKSGRPNFDDAAHALWEPDNLDASGWHKTESRCPACAGRLTAFHNEDRLHTVRCGYCPRAWLIKAGNPHMAAAMVGIPPEGKEDDPQDIQAGA